MTMWESITQWGNSTLLLPAALFIAGDLWSGESPRLGGRWVVAFGIAVSVVLISKIAFLGWGVGIRAIDFTGVSGHATLAAAVFPTLGWRIIQERSRSIRGSAVAVGAAVAALVGLSRIALHTHSVSEVVAGLIIGGLVAWLVIPGARTSQRCVPARWVALSIIVLSGTIWHGENADVAHDLVERLALLLSGRTKVFDRNML